MTLYIENQFITAIIENKLTIKEIKESKFETKILKFNADLWEWLDIYYGQNNQLPSDDLIATRFPSFQKVEVKDNPKEIIKSLIDGSKSDRFYQDLKQAVTLMQNQGSVEKVINFLESRFPKYSQTDEQTLFDITSDSFDYAKKDYEKRREAFLTNGHYGIPTGFGKSLDGYLGGFQRGDLFGILGQTGVSKTWILLVNALSALKAKNNILVVGLESNVTREYYRNLTLLSGINNTQIRSGVLPTEDFEKSEKIFRDLAKELGVKYYLEVLGRREKYTIKDLRKSIEKTRCNIVFVDYLTLMSDEGNEPDNWQTYLEVSKQLALIASGYNIPVVAVLQGNLNFDGKEEMSLSDTAQSKGMARDFSFIIGVSRVKGLNNIIKINSVKGRDSETSDFVQYYKTEWNTGNIKEIDYNKEGNF